MSGAGGATKHLIVNADDFGASSGVNRGIIESHQRGIVTSASLMVTGRCVDEAVRLSCENPDLSVGLHWDVCAEDERDFDLDDLVAVREEVRWQLDRFDELMGRAPTHVDSHRHAHRHGGVFDVVQEVVEPLGVPLRDDGTVRYVGGFYAQWEWKVTNLEYVSVEFLCRMLRDEVGEGWTEFGCHPGYRSPDYESVYLAEREAEVTTLTDAAVRRELDRQGISLRSYRDLALATPP
jgi:chitin disaccharide deacetylase